MTKNVEDKKLIGMTLAKRLKLKLNKLEGHDLAGPCIACPSSDAFRLHKQKGIAHCYSCGGSWSPYQVALQTLGNKAEAKNLMNELQIPLGSTSGPEASDPSREQDPLLTIAEQKGVDPEALKSYGVEFINSTTIDFPMYGPDGEECSSYKLFTDDSKGKFAYGKPAGLFFPHTDGVVRLPEPGETWYVVEGVKDAAAMYSLGYLACGLNTCHMAAKFALLFADVKVVLVPDRDRPSVNGADKTTAGLWGVAESISIVTLPVEFKDTKGLDVRDVLQLNDGEELLRQAIDDAKLIDSPPANNGEPPDGSSAEIKMPKGSSITLTVMPSRGQSQRLIVARRDKVSYRDQINTNSSVSRKRFTSALATKLSVEFDSLEPLIDSKLAELADQADLESVHTVGKPVTDKDGQATVAFGMAVDWDLWHTPDGDAYATFFVGDHRETWPLSSRRMKRHVAKCFFDREGKAISPEALASALNLMEGQALFDGDEHDVHIRMAEHEGNIYLDLCNPQWQVVEITPSGWQVLNESPVRFRRSDGMLALPVPEPGGNIDELRGHFNFDEDSWILTIGWIINAFCPRGPHPLLAIFAEQGSGKSTAARNIRRLIDPHRALLRSEDRSAHDLMIAAHNSWCLGYDNISYISPSFSDALCRMSTGGGFTTRKLYSDQDEQIFDARRPVLLTSIGEVVKRPDLLDRAVVARLELIPEEERRSESEIERDFVAGWPLFLGAVLNAVSGALGKLPDTRLSTLPRMADFALWVTAAEDALGFATGTFMAAYTRNRASANELAIEASPIGPPLLRLLQRRHGWQGSPTELLKSIAANATEETRRMRTFPKNGQGLTENLQRIQSNLRAMGWEAKHHRTAKRRTWTIRPVGQGDEDTSDETLQIDAEQRELFFDDDDDADDEVFPTQHPEVEQDEVGWEDFDE